MRWIWNPCSLRNVLVHLRYRKSFSGPVPGPFPCRCQLSGVNWKGPEHFSFEGGEGVLMMTSGEKFVGKFMHATEKFQKVFGPADQGDMDSPWDLPPLPLLAQEARSLSNWPHGLHVHTCPNRRAQGIWGSG